MPETITHFIIKELPDSDVIESLIDGNPIVLNTQYPIADQNLLTFEKQMDFYDLPLSVNFKYTVISSDNVESNEALGTLSWIGVLLTPSSSNVDLTILNDDIVGLLKVIPINDATAFIQIKSMIGVQNLTLNGTPIYINQILSIIDLHNTVFTAESEGGGDPYFELTYNVMDSNRVPQLTDYTLILDIVSLSELNIFSGPVVTNYTQDIDTGMGIVNYPVIEEEYYLEISGGYAFAVANVQIIINSAFLSLNAYNTVFIDDFTNEQYIERSNRTFNTNVQLDKLGKAQIKIVNYIVEDTMDPKNGDITITLVDLNGDSGLVDGLQQEQLISSF